MIRGTHRPLPAVSPPRSTAVRQVAERCINFGYGRERAASALSSSRPSMGMGMPRLGENREFRRKPMAAAAAALRGHYEDYRIP